MRSDSGHGQQLDADRVRAWYQRLVDEQGFSAVVLIARNGRVLLNHGFGLADDETKAPMTSSTVVLTGSISKQFTAAAIVRLETEGLLSVDDSIERFLPGVPPDKRGITIHHLLTHTAGFSIDHFGSDLTPMSLDEALAAIYELPLNAAPGEQYDYSNTGYTVLAAIVQRVSGRPFTDFMEEIIFSSAGLQATGFFTHDWSDDHVATAYLNGESQGKPSTFPGPFWGNMGNAGVMSTTADLYRWFQALRSGQIIGAEGTARLFAPYVRASETHEYAYGWALGMTELGPIISHSGLGLGGNSDLAYYPEQDLVIITLSNRAAFRWENGVVVDVWTPASASRSQLVKNLLADDFTTLPPKPGANGKIPATLLAFIAAGALVVAIGYVAWRRAKREAGKRALVVLIAAVVIMGCERQDPQAAEVTRSNPIVPLDSGLVQIETTDDTIRLNVEIAETPEQKSIGLMERRVLPDNDGMLFVYEEEQAPSDPFYMFRTRIPLDIVFMDSTGQVVAIRHMEPCTSPEPQWCEKYPPEVPYHAALEVNLGLLEEHGIGIGDRVRLVERFGS